MRAFIAIDLPQEVKNYLANLQTRLKTSGADVKWVEPQNIHLTLKFIGEIDEKTFKKIAFGDNLLSPVIGDFRSPSRFDLPSKSGGGLGETLYTFLYWDWDKIVSILEDVARDKNCYPINFSSLGAFPKIDFPRVIWVGIDKGEQETKKIAKGLEEKMEKIGIPAESRPFSSHITIGRTRSMLNRDKLIENLKIQESNLRGENLKFNVTKITLFKSILTPKRPIYEVLNETDLQGKYL